MGFTRVSQTLQYFVQAHYSTRQVFFRWCPQKVIIAPYLHYLLNMKPGIQNFTIQSVETGSKILLKHSIKELFQILTLWRRVTIYMASLLACLYSRIDNGMDNASSVLSVKIYNWLMMQNILTKTSKRNDLYSSLTLSLMKRPNNSTCLDWTLWQAKRGKNSYWTLLFIRISIAISIRTMHSLTKENLELNSLMLVLIKQDFLMTNSYNGESWE